MIFYNDDGELFILVLRNAYMCGEFMTGERVYERPFWDGQTRDGATPAFETS